MRFVKQDEPFGNGTCGPVKRTGPLGQHEEETLSLLLIDLEWTDIKRWNRVGGRDSAGSCARCHCSVSFWTFSSMVSLSQTERLKCFLSVLKQLCRRTPSLLRCAVQLSLKVSISGLVCYLTEPLPYHWHWNWNRFAKVRRKCVYVVFRAVLLAYK